MVLKPTRHGQEVPVVSFNHALQGIKSDLSTLLPAELIESLCDQLRLVGRRRVLTPTVTTYLALIRALHAAPMSALRHLSGFDVSAQAFCQGIRRLPVEYFARLQAAAARTCQNSQRSRADRWDGRRLFLIDGTAFSMPDTPPLQQAFGQHTSQRPGCGFPIAHLLIQFDAATGVALRTIASSWRTHDLAHAAMTHEALETGDILVGDRAFGSFAHLALLRRRGLHGVFRVHQRRPSMRGRSRERLVVYGKPAKAPSWMTDAEFDELPERLCLREVPVRIRTPGRRVQRLTLVTTLVDAVAFPAQMIADMFAVRWQAETNIGYLKQTLQLDVLRSQSVDGVLKELHCITIIYNLVRRVMLEAARRQRVEPHRVSFVDALRWLRQAQPGDELTDLIINPHRPNRFQPRVRKRRPKSFPLMTRPRHELKKSLASQAKQRLT